VLYSGAEMSIEDCRRFYAEEVRLAASVHSRELVEAYARVPREAFFGPAPWQIASAEQSGLALSGFGGAIYITTSDPCDLCHNMLIAIDPARHLNNGQPSALARWIDALDLKLGDRAVHIGCGVGYYTAIMAEVVGREGTVHGVEVDSDLANRARGNLEAYPQVQVHAGDGAALDTGECDAILVNAGVTHPHLAWLERLAEGGRLVLPITASFGASRFGSGLMVKIVRDREGWSARSVSPVAIYSCTSVRDPEMEPILAKALAAKSLLKMKSARLDPHEPDESCVLHRNDVCLSAAERQLSPQEQR
jgi:protein-L-isoaspartate(D-aspartate) O-methyltransferase